MINLYDNWLKIVTFAEICRKISKNTRHMQIDTMGGKVFYRINPRTGTYERVYPTRSQRIAVTARRVGFSLLLAVALLGILYSLIELPREAELRRRNEALEARVEMLSRQADEAIAVMEDIAERDNNFYRVMAGAEPLPEAGRYAGLERQRNYERLDSMADDVLVQELDTKLDILDRMLVSQIESFDRLAGDLAERRDRIAHIPAIQPVPERYLRAMASGYGLRVDPIYGTRKFHEGMDFSAPIGTPVYATADGKVITASRQGLYGNLVEVDHGYGYVTRYAHLSRIECAPGQTVRRGELIGMVGNTGKSTGPHLHYEVRLRGQAQNPVNYYYYDLSPEEYEQIISIAETAGNVMD